MAKQSVWEKNFAFDSRVRDRALTIFGQITRRRMDERVDLEEKWLEFFRMWNVEKDDNSGYNGRSNLYIPEVRKNVEAQARQLTEAAFPNDDYLSCTPLQGTFKGADLQLEMRKFQIRQAKLKTQFHSYARQRCLYGTSPVFVPWRNNTRKIWMSRKSGKKITAVRSDVEIFNGPDFIPHDLMRWYALDPLSRDFQEAGCFYNSLVDKEELQKRDKAGKLFGYRDLISKAADALSSSELERFIEKVESSGLVLEKSGYAGDVDLSQTKGQDNKMLCTQIFAIMELPEGLMDDEDKNLPVPVIIEMYNSGHIGLVKRNPFFHQQAPYVCGRYIIPGPEQFYGQGIPWAIQFMQHEINSKADQAMDSATLALNPIAFIDPAMAGNMLEFPVEPGAVWQVSPQGVKLSSIPDTTQTGYNAIAMLRAQMADYSDRSPALPQQLQGKSRTATQSDIVSSALNVDTKSFASLDEEMVLEPAMEMWESLTDQNIQDKQIILVSGGDFKKAKQVLVRKNQLLGRYTYQWNAASLTQNRQILARQLIDAMKVYGTLPPQIQAQTKFRMDMAFRALIREGMNLPDVERYFGEAGQESTDVETEYEMLKEGLEISVSPGDNDLEHMKAHDEKLKDGKLDEDQKAILMAHIAEHQAQMEAKQKAIEMARAQMAQMQAMQQQQGSAANSGNRTQLSPNGSVGDMASGNRA